MISYHYRNAQAVEQLASYLSQHLPEEFIVVCIGTDRCIGDSLGPLIGSLLCERQFPHPIYGTLHEPVHALNIRKTIRTIQQQHPNTFILAIDASLGASEQIGFISIRTSPIAPGKGVGKKLPSIGDLSIIGIVASVDDEIHTAIHNIRLSLIMDLAHRITEVLMGCCHTVEDSKSTY